MEPTEQLAVILPALSELVDRIEPSDLGNETPCEKFALSDVLDHMIVLGGSFSFLFRGLTPAEPQPREEDGSVPTAEFRKVMHDLLDAVHTEGALDRTITAPVGEMPGDTFARLVAFDGVIHGWDIARATGLAWELPDEVVAAVDSFARIALTDDLRDGDTFKDATTAPADATPIDRIAAFSGRTV
jgi:uncharacterized protein (TIGR03086 family)